MLAAHHDQENLVRHQAVAANGKPGTRHGPPKTPGARYPKTPLKIPLNDENVVNAGKSVLAGRLRPAGAENTMLNGKAQALATPATRPRTVLGNKTTNAKARQGQSAGVKDIVKEIEKAQVKPTTTQKPKPLVVSGPPKVEILADQKGPLGEEDIEYCPPRDPNSRYESDVFPDGVLTFEGLRPENLLKGYYSTYYNPLDEDGVSLRDREFERTMRRAAEETDRRILQDIENTDWSVCDVPETFAPSQGKQAPLPSNVIGQPASSNLPKPPATLNSRKAAKNLSIPTDATKGRALKPISTNAPVKTSRFLISGNKADKKPVAARINVPKATGVAASRSTIGYTKGRSASSIVHNRPNAAGPARPMDSDATITPASFSQAQAGLDDFQHKLQFLSIFDIDEDEVDDAFQAPSDALGDIEEEEFELKLGI